MKKILSYILATMALCLISSPVWAIPAVWTDTIDFNPDVYIGEDYTYTHDLTDNGFYPAEDIITSYALSIALKDDDDYVRSDWFEALFELEEQETGWVDQPGWIADGLAFTYVNNLYGWSFSGLFSLNETGKLDVTISSLCGDFLLDKSTLVAVGCENSEAAPVPEPATLMLIGSGLIGLAGFRRRQK